MIIDDDFGIFIRNTIILYDEFYSENNSHRKRHDRRKEQHLNKDAANFKFIDKIKR